MTTTPTPSTSTNGAVTAAVLELLADAHQRGAARLEAELESAASAGPKRVRLVVDWHRPESPAIAPQKPATAVGRLPWHAYSQELRDALKALAIAHPPATVAAAALELAELLEQHGAGGRRAALALIEEEAGR